MTNRDKRVAGVIYLIGAFIMTAGFVIAGFVAFKYPSPIEVLALLIGEFSPWLQSLGRVGDQLMFFAVLGCLSNWLGNAWIYLLAGLAGFTVRLQAVYGLVFSLQIVRVDGSTTETTA